MRVRAIHPHFSTDGALHERGSEYELAGDELAFRLKDQIVAELVPVIVAQAPVADEA
jgi:hypothetical protein